VAHLKSILSAAAEDGHQTSQDTDNPLPEEVSDAGEINEIESPFLLRCLI
jgi:hypothetical protein